MKKKKIIAGILALSMVFGMAVTFNGGEMNVISVSASAEEFATSGWCGKNATWKYDVDKSVLTVSGTGELYDMRDFTSFPEDISEEEKWDNTYAW